MKIGFFTDGYKPQINGVAISVEECAKALAKRGHEVYIIAPSYPNLKKEKNVFRLRSITVHKKFNIRAALVNPGTEVYKILRQDFDIIHGHTGGPISMAGIEFAKLKKIPYVFTYHTFWDKYVHYFLRGKVITPRMVRLISRVLIGRCSTVIAPTQKVKEELISYGVKKPIFVIPNCIDLKKFKTEAKGFLRKKFKLAKQDKIILFVGRLGKEKSIDFLVSAFSLINKTCKNTKLVIVGNGPEKENLQYLAKKLELSDKVLFAGEISYDILPKVYGDADMFVFASTTETQGMVIMEAMASGLPIVAVRDGAIRSMIGNKINGILVKKDEQKFAKQVINLLKNKKLREKLSVNAKKRVAKFSEEKTVEKLEKLYQQVMT
ncbi:MAG: glycosyltransferase family 4 protein [Candidatus Levybacteria bacterium CG_4_9_14_3_um_filter_35_16]|nr:MAG: glycosyl transferase family 1 [Candidatus Levybacteria bacterium CG22_combo_CG10-13_8_21_14_all_35_11]PIY94003.1 MAG: glycosyltransferase family 4 protein [Candidatus Levybacteria bacterium CG_4_10_14_0_8_um_filter_35_23]PIZ97588.1 MAG: glycosyltransferase family 4 protein [Candidatus Levybacteria bacterium CG_4_10_14_0_2_um_filter_35_8]PJA91582.1 MAG: glycosyltransferase family 4 protein [Candidatus Levybacteria bacterium CG_4_9_14_3_um_filter_35_16]PJC54497.1 MAG: glycosyltransferase 